MSLAVIFEQIVQNGLLYLDLNDFFSVFVVCFLRLSKEISLPEKNAVSGSIIVLIS